MAFVLDQLKPNQKYFEAICGIPHPSTEKKAVSDYVLRCGKARFKLRAGQILECHRAQAGF